MRKGKNLKHKCLLWTGRFLLVFAENNLKLEMRAKSFVKHNIKKGILKSLKIAGKIALGKKEPNFALDGTGEFSFALTLD